MIPPFEDSGFLPQGVHRASLDEVLERFGRGSELRRVQMESVRWTVELAIRTGALRVVWNGSFVTDIMEPNDVDCVILMPSGRPKDLGAFRELRVGLPFMDLAIVRGARRFDEYVQGIFARDRFGSQKGTIEVKL